MVEVVKLPAGKRSKKQAKSNIDIQVVLLIFASIILGILIYTRSGFIGENLSPFLGGIIGWVKFIIPIGMGLITVYIMKKKTREDIVSKLIKYAVFIIAISVLITVYHVLRGNLNIEYSFEELVGAAYEQGGNNVGGGAVGAIFAIPLINLLGPASTIVLSVCVATVMSILLFGLKPLELVTGFKKNLAERETLENEDDEKYAAAKLKRREELRQYREEQKRVKEEQKHNKKMGRDMAREMLGDDAIDGIESAPIDPDEDKIDIKLSSEAGLFKKAEEEKEDKTKEVLVLEHGVREEEAPYEFPSITYLKAGTMRGSKNAKREVKEIANRLEGTLKSFGVSAEVESVSVGPTITRYELKPAEGVRVNKIANLSDDIALSLAAETIRIEAPIPGKQAVGIEIPNKDKEIVALRDILESDNFQESDSKISFALGKDPAGEEFVTDIAKMPHVLIAGSTGSGKSVCINTLITSIIYKAKPSEVKLVMIDPKVVELSAYNGIPHLLIPVVTDARKAAGALAWAVQEMVNRYTLFSEKKVRDLAGYNNALAKEGIEEKLPQIVIIIDELADLMMVAKNDVEDAICRLAQMARAAGMHLVVATQRPSVDVITGIIKANIATRISFAVTSQVDSRTILDSAGAEKLLGKGDMLFFPTGVLKPIRIQGAFISDKEVEKIVTFLKSQGGAVYNEDVLDKIENSNKSDKDMDEEGDDIDPFLGDAIEMAVETGQASASFIQRRFKVGYARAGRIIDQMEARGIISGYEGSKPRKVLITKEQLHEMKMGSSEEVQEEIPEEVES
ncbi:MAG: DNA translocase FtsK [Oscillospiraceae bacterium]|nr:DNA translocase FtsK [Oscillospiraceae bacterium]